MSTLRAAWGRVWEPFWAWWQRYYLEAPACPCGAFHGAGAPHHAEQGATAAAPAQELPRIVPADDRR